jgi:hypothetical protein
MDTKFERGERVLQNKYEYETKREQQFYHHTYQQ